MPLDFSDRAAKPQGQKLTGGLDFSSRARRGGVVETIAGGMANFNRGTGFLDEMAAAGGVLTGVVTGRHKLTDPVVETFQKELAYQRGTEDQFAAERPRWALGLKGLGMGSTTVVPVGGAANVFAQGGRIANAARGATLAGGQAAAYAAADRGTAQERLSASSRAARDPLTLALGAGGGALATARKGKPQAPPAYPTVAELEKTKRDLYTQANASGFTFADNDMRGLSQRVTAEFQKRAGSGPEGKMALPIGNSLRARLDEMAKTGNVTLEQLDALRADAYEMAVAQGGAESIIGRFLRSEIDQLMDSYNVPLIKEARQANTQWMKAREIANRQRSGELGAASANSGQNVVNAQRAKIRPTIDPLHSSEITNWTPEEAAAVERVVMGSPEANRLRDTGNILRNPLFNAVGGIAGGFAGGGVPAVVAPALMQLAGRYFRKAAENVTAKDIEALQRLIAEGRVAAPPGYGPPIAGIAGREAARLSTAAGVAGGARASEAPPNIFAQP
jgi:hypothetical protein